MLQALYTQAKAGPARALNHRSTARFAAWSGWPGRAFLTLSCFWLLQAPALAQEPQNYSVRVATYNAYLLSPLFKCQACA